MFIRELHIDGYGALQALKLPLDAPVTVIYGPNEAGKSTVLRFIRSLLYGFPTRKEPVERGEPVLGGRHGGRMCFTDASGEEYILERYADKGNGLKLWRLNGEERLISQAQWEQLMLGGISERLFRQLFAVSLNELNELRTLQGEEVGNYIYHAGIAGGAALTAARKQIHAEMDRIYRPRGTTQDLNQVLAAMKELDASIRTSRDVIVIFNETKEAHRAANQRLMELDSRLPLIRKEVVKLQNAYDLREWWLKREALRLTEMELRQALARPDLPLISEEQVMSWTSIKEAHKAASDQLKNARERLIELQQRRTALTWNEELTASYTEWERLESMREGMVAKREEITQLEAEHLMLEDTLQSLLARISEEWDEEKLSFGGLAAQRYYIRQLQQAMEQAESTSLALQSDIRRITRQQEVLKAEEASLEAERVNPSRVAPGAEFPFQLFIPRTRAALRQAWHKVEDARRSYDLISSKLHAVKRAEAIGNEESTARRRAVRSPSPHSDAKARARRLYQLSGILGMIAIVLLWLSSQGEEINFPGYGTALILLLLSAGLVVITMRQKSNQRDQEPNSNSAMAAAQKWKELQSHRRQLIDVLRQLIHDPESAAAKLAPEYPLDGSEEEAPSPEEDELWTQLRQAVYMQLDALELEDQENAKQQELTRRFQELKHEQELIEQEIGEQQIILADRSTQWQQWLMTYSLPVHLTPEVMPELLGLVEQGQGVLRQRQRVRDRLQLLHQALQDFKQAAIPLFERCQSFFNPRSDIVQSVQWLYREASQQLAIKEDAKRLDREMAAVSAEMSVVQGRLDELETRRAALLEELQADSETELEQRIRIDERCAVHRKEAREIELRIEAGRDAQSRSQLYHILESYDEDALSSELTELKSRLAEDEAERASQLDRRGRLAQELERLRTEDELKDKMLKLSELQTQLEQLSEQYAILAISDHLMKTTKAVFEKEKQPEVLRRASQYYEQMTEGLYTRIIAPGDSLSLLAQTRDHRLVDSAFLSRGTQEQLYLSMRLALCNAASAEKPLPLLLDDLFVHFDERRLENMLPVLEELSTARQVILFTCHSHVAQAIRNGIPSAQVLSLPHRQEA